MFNSDLAKKLNVEHNIPRMKARHRIRDLLDKCMHNAVKAESDITEIKSLLRVWTVNEFELQELWGFERDENYHKFWLIPDCTCPKIDNEDSYPSGYYTISGKCPIHGDIK